MTNVAATMDADDQTYVGPNSDTEYAPDYKAIEWKRTPDQEEMVAKHLANIQVGYAGAPHDLYAALTDETVLGTAEIAQILEFTRPTRVFQFYTERRDLAAAFQTPHPSAMPEPDASGGHRGAREITGVMKGRFVHWTLHSGRTTWDALKRAIELQKDLNHGGAPRGS